MKDQYTIKELADKLNVSTRTVERYLQGLYTKENNKIVIPLDVVNLLEVRHKSDTNTDTSPTQKYDVIEAFTNEEYQEFQKRLIEYPILQRDLEYHRESAKSHQRQMELILRNLEQRNFIEASDKKLKE
ncbi:helix-turn-helix transcriptional regulator [Flavimarina sp. Hel_I_48]|uniref:helix-turn-helix transcriptional regulator n=1 Tax=Flavimarina sp. Hel_I_48 TaxID=1392488 RepID=UPI0004DF8CDA|nr:HTH domain-containing protein [Flavimarina sp. Hel_I_48]